MTVSNEDRDTAAEMLQHTACLQIDPDCPTYYPSAGDVDRILAALIAHGWGPRPSVSRADLFDWADGVACWVEDGICEHLTKAGIEVSE